MGRFWQEERSDGEDAASLLDRRGRLKKNKGPCFLFIDAERLVFLKSGVLGDWRAGARLGAVVKGRRAGDARKKIPPPLKRKRGRPRRKKGSPS